MTDAPQWEPRFVLFYFSSESARARVPEVFPAHHRYTEAFRAERPGQLLMTGPLQDAQPGQPGAMNVFLTREAAEEFPQRDPFVVEGVVESWAVRTWLTSPIAE